MVGVEELGELGVVVVAEPIKRLVSVHAQRLRLHHFVDVVGKSGINWMGQGVGVLSDRAMSDTCF